MGFPVWHKSSEPSADGTSSRQPNAPDAQAPDVSTSSPASPPPAPSFEALLDREELLLRREALRNRLQERMWQDAELTNHTTGRLGDFNREALAREMRTMPRYPPPLDLRQGGDLDRESLAEEMMRTMPRYPPSLTFRQDVDLDRESLAREVRTRPRYPPLIPRQDGAGEDNARGSPVPLLGRLVRSRAGESQGGPQPDSVRPSADFDRRQRIRASMNLLNETQAGSLRRRAGDTVENDLLSLDEFLRESTDHSLNRLDIVRRSLSSTPPLTAAERRARMSQLVQRIADRGAVHPLANSSTPTRPSGRSSGSRLSATVGAQAASQTTSQTVQPTAPQVASQAVSQTAPQTSLAPPWLLSSPPTGLSSGSSSSDINQETFDTFINNIRRIGQLQDSMLESMRASSITSRAASNLNAGSSAATSGTTTRSTNQSPSTTSTQTSGPSTASASMTPTPSRAVGTNPRGTATNTASTNPTATSRTATAEARLRAVQSRINAIAAEFISLRAQWAQSQIDANRYERSIRSLQQYLPTAGAEGATTSGEGTAGTDADTLELNYEAEDIGSDAVTAARRMAEWMEGERRGAQRAFLEERQRDPRILVGGLLTGEYSSGSLASGARTGTVGAETAGHMFWGAVDIPQGEELREGARNQRGGSPAESSTRIAISSLLGEGTTAQPFSPSERELQRELLMARMAEFELNGMR